MPAKANAGDGTAAPGDDGTVTPDAAIAPEVPAAVPVPGGAVTADAAAAAADVKAPAAQDAPPAAAPLSPPAAKAAPAAKAPAAAEANAAVYEAPAGGGSVIVGHDGEPIHPDDLFTSHGDHVTWLEAARDILRRVHFPGQQRDSMKSSTQLVARAGTKIPRDQAHVIIQEARDAAAAAEGAQG